MKLQRLVI